MEKNENGSCEIEAFLNKLAANGKSLIVLPLTQEEATRRIGYLFELLDKGAISKGTFNSEQKQVNARSLDAELFKEFHEIIGKKLQLIQHAP